MKHQTEGGLGGRVVAHLTFMQDCLRSGIQIQVSRLGKEICLYIGPFSQFLHDSKLCLGLNTPTSRSRLEPLCLGIVSVSSHLHRTSKFKLRTITKKSLFSTQIVRLPKYFCREYRFCLFLNYINCLTLALKM